MTQEQNKLAEEIGNCGFYADPDGTTFRIIPAKLSEQIISALREPATEAVLVPRDALILWACYLEDADSRLGPYLLGAKRDTSYKEAAEEIRLRLAGTFSCPHCGITTPHEHSVDRKGNALKGKGASQGAEGDQILALNSALEREAVRKLVSEVSRLCQEGWNETYAAAHSNACEEIMARLEILWGERAASPDEQKG